MNQILNVFLLSFLASLGTGIGGLVAVLRTPGRRSYGLLMGFTAGVMICLAFLELVDKAWELGGFWTATIGFGTGATFMFILDHFAPHVRFGETEIRGLQEQPDCLHRKRPFGGRHRFGQLRFQNQVIDQQLIRSGLLLSVGITLHNLPEGIAVGAGYIHTPQFGIFIASAIMLHNIPEGIATALPICKGGVCRGDAVRIAFLSGLAEPVGAVIASLFLVRFGNFVPGSLAFAGGVMVFITLDELIPIARMHGHEHYVAIGIILGSIAVFLLSGTFGV